MVSPATALSSCNSQADVLGRALAHCDAGYDLAISCATMVGIDDMLTLPDKDKCATVAAALSAAASEARKHLFPSSFVSILCPTIYRARVTTQVDMHALSLPAR